MSEGELPPGASAGAHMLAGALAGFVEHAVTFPLDSIKTRMQVLGGTPALGVRLYAGVGVALAGAAPAHALHFATYEYVRKTTGAGRGADWEGIRLGAAGAAAAAAADACMTPFDVVKQRLQMAPGRHTGALSCARAILRAEGLRAFFVSYPTTLAMNVPFHAVQVPVYEAVRGVLSRWTRSEGSPGVHLAAGAAAGGAAALVTTPLDVVKTTLQTAAATRAADAPPGGVRDALRLLFSAGVVDRTRGALRFGVFFRGALPRTLAHVPSTALCWAVYEYFKLAFV